MTEHSLSKRNPSFYDAVEAVGSTSKLHILVGAGVSIDVGLPSWSGLLRTVLEKGLQAEQARDTSLFDDRNRSWYEAEAQQILEQTDAVSTATVARLLLGDDALVDHVRLALYASQKYGVQPGRIAFSIARLLRIMPRGSSVVVTTNYDDLLEYAIAETFGFERPKVNSIGAAKPVSSEKGQFSVKHLHGMLGKRRGDEILPIVLDEKGYAASAEAQQALDELFQDDEATVLIVGSSMADTNLVAALYRARAKGVLLPVSHSHKDRVFGMFVDAQSSIGVRKIQQSRLEDLGVRPVHLLSYLQISQVLNEMILSRLAGTE